MAKFIAYFSLLLSSFLLQFQNNSLISPLFKKSQLNKSAVSRFDISTPLSSPSPSPTPRPLTFEEMNKLYGPCISLPVLMYHHIQPERVAKDKKQTTLSVYTDIFNQQIQYLKGKGYSFVTPASISNFFESGTKPANKSVLITFDDAYEDNFTDAYPILKNLGITATIFTPTGLINIPGYLSWSQVQEMASSNIIFANHTWSHKSVSADTALVIKEISTADIQLTEKDLNNLKVFAYPYGSSNKFAQQYLENIGYKLAFTTSSGRIHCQKLKFQLPRIRVGNFPLSIYGL